MRVRRLLNVHLTEAGGICQARKLRSGLGTLLLERTGGFGLACRLGSSYGEFLLESRDGFGLA